MDFAIPADIQSHARRARRVHRGARSSRSSSQDDNIRFFDHRREWARTDFDNGGVPRAGLGGAARARCAAVPTPPAGCAWPCPPSSAVASASNLEMAIIREHLATKGLGLHNDLQNESSIVGNFPTVLMMRDFGTPEQVAEWMPGFLDGITPPRVRPHRAEPRQRRHVPRDDRGPRRRRVGDQRDEAVELRPAPRHPRHHLRPHVRRRRASRSGSPPSSCRPTRPASRSSSSGGRSTCRPTTPRCR